MVASRFWALGLSVLSSVFVQSAVAAPHEPLVQRDVSRNGDPGYIGAGTYPRATKLSDGSLLSCYTASVNGNFVLSTAKSTNGGWDWTQLGTVTTAAKASHDTDNCFVHQLSSGRVLAAFRNHDRTTVNGPYTYYRITVCYSDDGGATWKYLSQAATSGTAGLGLWEPFMMDGTDGAVMLYFSREVNTNGSDQDNIVVRSYDGGATWSSEVTVSGAGIVCRDGMVGVARTGGNNLLAVFESLLPDSGILSVTSSDDGKTWGNRRVVYKSTVSGAVHGAPQVSLVGSKLVASFQVNEDDLSRKDVKVVTSTNTGASWGEKTTVLNACVWAGSVTVDSGHLLVMCDASGSALAQTMNVS